MFRQGDQKLTPHDDQLAELLADLGFSYRRIGELLSVTDKTAKTAVERSRSKEGGRLTRETQKRAESLLGFHKWMQVGATKGYLPILASYLQGDEK